MGCHSLLQGVFPTQGLNVGLLHCRRILYPLSLLDGKEGRKEGRKEGSQKRIERDLTGEQRKGNADVGGQERAFQKR